MAKYATTEELIHCKRCTLDFSVSLGEPDIRGGDQMYITDNNVRCDLYKFTCPRCETWLGSQPIQKEIRQAWTTRPGLWIFRNG